MIQAQQVYLVTQDQIDEMVEMATEKITKKIEAFIAKLQAPRKERYTYDEFCEEYDCCKPTIRAWDRAGIVKITGLGKKRYVEIVNQEYMDRRALKKLTKL